LTPLTFSSLATSYLSIAINLSSFSALSNSIFIFIPNSVFEVFNYFSNVSLRATVA